jgi:hypothetical protein
MAGVGGSSLEFVMVRWLGRRSRAVTTSGYPAERAPRTLRDLHATPLQQAAFDKNTIGRSVTTRGYRAALDLWGAGFDRSVRARCVREAAD